MFSRRPPRLRDGEERRQSCRQFCSRRAGDHPGSGGTMGGVLAGLVILLIGDSHMSSRDYLDTTLHDTLITEGAVVHTYGQCATNAADWIYKVTAPCRAERHGTAPAIYGNTVMPTWVLGDLIAQNHPNLVMVELADTMAGYDKADLPRPWIYEQVHEMVGRITAQHISCVWIGPTWATRIPAITRPSRG